MPSDIQPHSRTGTLLALQPGRAHQGESLTVQSAEVAKAKRRLISLWSTATCRAKVANPRASWSSLTHATPAARGGVEVSILITRTE